MGQTHHLQLNRQAYEWAKLIRKLRWIGMEDDAHQLQLAMCDLPPHEAPTNWKAGAAGCPIDHTRLARVASTR